MGIVVVQHEMDVIIFRNIPVDFIEKTVELHRPVTAITFANYLPRGNVQSSEE
jgi:hypothetical protein